MNLLSLPWAIHISDGTLSWPWLVGCFLLIGLLALLSACRVAKTRFHESH